MLVRTLTPSSPPWLVYVNSLSVSHAKRPKAWEWLARGRSSRMDVDCFRCPSRRGCVHVVRMVHRNPKPPWPGSISAARAASPCELTGVESPIVVWRGSRCAVAVIVTGVFVGRRGSHCVFIRVNLPQNHRGAIAMTSPHIVAPAGVFGEALEDTKFESEKWGSRRPLLQA